MGTFAYPTSAELSTIGPEYVAAQIQERVGFQLMPIINANAATVQWEQKDSYFGLQQLRGLDGAPNYVARLGSNRYSMEPGSYGEFMGIDEGELTRRANTTGGVPVDISDLVIEAQQALIGRELDRIEYIIWTLLTTGTFTVSLPGTGVAHKDTFTLQTATKAVDWDTAASATPLADFRTVLAKGSAKGVNFGAGAAYMNQATANKLLSITNTADIGGRRTLGGGTINSIPMLNVILQGEGLPRIEVYDGGYQSAASTFTNWIPTDKVVFVGRRKDGSTIGNYKMTRNINAPGLVGSYDVVKNYFTGENAVKTIPGKIEIHRGHNGGPALYFPGSICVLSV